MGGFKVTLFVMTVRAQDQKGMNSINRVWNKNNLAVMLPVSRTVPHTSGFLLLSAKMGIYVGTVSLMSSGGLMFGVFCQVVVRCLGPRMLSSGMFGRL